MVLVDEFRDCEGRYSAILEQRSGLEAARQLFTCTGDRTGQSVIEGSSFSEMVCVSSNCNGDIVDPADGVHASRNYSVDSVNSSIDQEASVVGKGGPENGRGNMVFLVSEEAPQNECGVNGLCSNQRGKDYKSSCLMTEECFGREESKCDSAPGNLSENEEISLASSPLTDSLNQKTQNDKRATVDVNDSVEEVVTDADVQKVVEDKCDVLTRVSGNLITEASLIEASTHNFKQRSLDIASNCSMNDSASLQSSQPVLDNISSQALAVSDLQEGDVVDGVLTCSSMVDYIGYADNGGKDSVRPSSAVSVLQEGDGLSSALTCGSMLCNHLNNYSFKEGSSNLVSDCPIEDSASLHSCQPDMEIISSQGLAMPDLQESGALGSALTCSSTSSIDDYTRHVDDEGKDNAGPDSIIPDLQERGSLACSNIVDYAVHADNEREDNAGSGSVSASNCPDTIGPILRRSTRLSKLNKMSETRKATKQCSSTANGILHLSGTIGIFKKTSRGKRSCPCKRARSSVWGALGNIMEVFEQNDAIQNHELDLTQLPSHGSQKTRGGQRSKKQKTRKGGNSRRSKRKFSASTGGACLKVTMGEEVGQRNLKAVLPEAVDPSASVQVSECDSDQGINLDVSKAANMGDVEQKLSQDAPTVRQFHCPSENLGKPISAVDISELDVHLTDKDLESTVTQDMSIGNIGGACHVLSSQITCETVGEATENRYLDVETSPDSEVINLIHDVHVGSGVQEDLHAIVSTSSQDAAIPTEVIVSNRLAIYTKKGKKNVEVKGSSYSLSGSCKEEGGLLGPEKKNKNKKPVKNKSRQRVGHNLDHSEPIENASSNSSGLEGCSTEPLLLVGGVEPGVSQESLKGELCPSSGQDVGVTPSESSTSEGSFSAAKIKGRKLPKMFKHNVGANKCRPRIPTSARRRKENNHERKGGRKGSKCKIKEKGPLDHKKENHLQCGSGTDMDFSSGVKRDSASSEPDDLNKINVGNDMNDELGRTKIDNHIATEDVSSSSMVSIKSEEQFMPPRNAWVRCDDCYKWRCISAALADSIEETNCRWTCKDNADKAFADCSIPQEKSNAEINAELEISDASGEEDAYDVNSCRQLTAPQQASWTLIKSNLFLHRSRKSQTIDEIMVCHCKPPLDGSLGCGDECLNRMLNIECVQGTCPCGDQCSNQQFQREKYAKFKWFRCGKKGYGLQLLEDVSQGQFLIEYVGEVLDLHAYEARQREYASRGQRHFYFMTLNGSEVIDACAKGNLGRFINHSCDPNCRTEKWMVNGEVCIGLFALRHIKKGEEITFDYNYVRVFGAAAKICYCGASDCRGYIGGDPSNTEIIVQGDSDEEYPEPVMIDEDGYNKDNNGETISSTCVSGRATQHAEVPLQTRDALNQAVSTIGQLELSLDNEDITSRSSAAVPPSEVSLTMENNISKTLSTVGPLDVSLQTEDTIGKSSSAVQLLEVSFEKQEAMNKSVCTSQTLDTCFPDAKTVRKSATDFIDAKKSRCDAVEHKRTVTKSHPLMKSSRSSSSIKKSKNSAYPMITNKLQVMASKPRKLLESAANDRFEGVEEKLNELLDAEGGISKRKDAPKGYLKLLFVTAASGDNSNGEPFHSTRDLSMILDAFLKTKSRTVLNDIINKNGLQMLHNIMKQNRKDFSKIPILRKLLKVLEYLALRGVLTLEHINRDPPHPGIESFKDSILILTRHNDVQVHHIARNFRDRWIPRSIRKVSYSDRDDIKLELQGGPNSSWLSLSHKRWNDQGLRPTEAINCVTQAMHAANPLGTDGQEGSSIPYISSCPPNVTRMRKFKSRWDQPVEKNLDLQLPHMIKKQKVEPISKQKLEPSAQQLESCEVVQDQIMEVDNDKNVKGCILSQQDEAATRVDASYIQDAPPGFSSLKSSPVPSNPSAVTTAEFSSKEAGHVGCGCEVIMGTAQARYLSHLSVSYGIPLSFVQQLGTLQAESVDCWTIAPGIPFHPFPPLPPFPRDRSNSSSPASTANPVTTNACGGLSTSGERRVDVTVTGTSNQEMVERVRCSSNGLGRRYFRQKKLNNYYRYPWLRTRNGWGFKGNNSRNGVYNVGVGRVVNESRTVCLDGVSSGGENLGSSLYQIP